MGEPQSKLCTAPFELFEQVRIKQLEDCKGMITGILLDSDGVQYRVVYWWEGVRRAEWLYPPEIAKRSVSAEA